MQWKIKRVTCDFRTNTITRNQGDGLDLASTRLLDIVWSPNASGCSSRIVQHRLNRCISKEILHFAKSFWLCLKLRKYDMNKWLFLFNFIIYCFQNTHSFLWFFYLALFPSSYHFEHILQLTFYSLKFVSFQPFLSFIHYFKHFPSIKPKENTFHSFTNIFH